MKKNDLFLGLYLLVPIVFLIVPIHPTLLDILILFNISIALVILFTALFSKEALNMSSFPTILLMTTLFRISCRVYEKYSDFRLCRKCCSDFWKFRRRWQPDHWRSHLPDIDYYPVYCY